MRHYPIPAAFTVLLLAGTMAAPAAAQRWTTVNERQARLDDRIDAGIRSGQLDRREAERLRGEFRAIARLEARYRTNGLSAAERRDLDRRFDGLSRRIRDERQDRQTALGWFGGYGWSDARGSWVSIDQRQRELDRRIDAGIAQGALTRDEARRLRGQFRAIERREADYRRGGLTAAERADLDRRFDRLALAIRWEANDRQIGYGYGPRR